jgi:hypothetical protein
MQASLRWRRTATRSLPWNNVEQAVDTKEQRRGLDYLQHDAVGHERQGTHRQGDHGRGKGQSHCHGDRPLGHLHGQAVREGNGRDYQRSGQEARVTPFNLLPTVQTGYEQSLLICLGPTGTNSHLEATLLTTWATLRTARGCRTWPKCTRWLGGGGASLAVRRRQDQPASSCGGHQFWKWVSCTCPQTAAIRQASRTGITLHGTGGQHYYSYL